MQNSTTHLLVSPRGGFYTQHRSEKAAKSQLAWAIRNNMNQKDGVVMTREEYLKIRNVTL